jgi:hypothetical protein
VTVTWQPHTLTTEEVVEHGPVAALPVLCDSMPRTEVGGLLPALWHWMTLLRGADLSGNAAGFDDASILSSLDVELAR